MGALEASWSSEGEHRDWHGVGTLARTDYLARV